VWAQQPTGPLWHAPWSGAPNPLWLAAPVTLRYIKRWGRRHATRGLSRTVHPRGSSPTDKPYRSRARSNDGKHRHRHLAHSMPSPLPSTMAGSTGSSSQGEGTLSPLDITLSLAVLAHNSNYLHKSYPSWSIVITVGSLRNVSLLCILVSLLNLYHYSWDNFMGVVSISEELTRGQFFFLKLDCGETPHSKFY
jgi:hypothetical protein